MWQRIELSVIGVPLPNLQNQSKVIFTTRSSDVCGQMGVKKAIKVEILSSEEAWELFQENVQNDVIHSHPHILELAKTMAEECGGLPLVLLVVARTMACKTTLEEWKHAIEILRRSAFEFPGMGEALPRMKYSYDNLTNETVRSCFLYYSVLWKRYGVPKDWWIEYWMSEGLVDGYNKGYSIIGDLVRACLLEEEENHWISMHDVIWDMAIWIANEIEKQGFLIKANAKLTEAPEVRNWEGMRRISLMENEIKNLSEIPTCPHLVALLLPRNEIEMIADDFFRSMPSLKVLDLSSNYRLTALPYGFSKLTSLQYLNLAYTSLQEFPEELKELVNPNFLDLNHIGSLHTLPQRLIASFSKLQVLKMTKCGTPEGAPEDSIFYDGSEDWIEELFSLKHLSRLDISLKTSHSLRKFFNSSKLYSCTGYLHLQNIEDVESLDVSCLADANHLDGLDLQGLANLEEMKIDYGGMFRKMPEAQGLHSLGSVFIANCSKLREVTWLVFASGLMWLQIEDCYDMEEVINPEKMGETYKDMIGYLKPFAKLQALSLEGLQNLKSISRDAWSFSQMKLMYIRSCPKLNSLPIDCHSQKFDISGEEDWWTKLQWEDEAILRAFLPFFKPTWR